jgi:hypothetical protein
MSEKPENWVNKIFDILESYYAEKWRNQFSSQTIIDIYKMIWENGLNGLSYMQLKHGLAVCKKNSKNFCSKPPNVIQFYSYCVKYKVP